METQKELEKKLVVFTSVYWGVDEISVIAECGRNKAAKIKRAVVKKNGFDGIYVTKIKRDEVCKYLGIDPETEIKMIREALYELNN